MKNKLQQLNDKILDRAEINKERYKLIKEYYEVLNDTLSDEIKRYFINNNITIMISNHNYIQFTFENHYEILNKSNFITEIYLPLYQVKINTVKALLKLSDIVSDEKNNIIIKNLVREVQ